MKKTYIHILKLSLHILRNALANLEPSLTFTGTHGDSTNINRLVSSLLDSTVDRWKMKNEEGAGPVVKTQRSY